MSDISVFADYKGFDVEIVIIDYDYTPEIPERGPSYASGGEPGWPEEVYPTDGYVVYTGDNEHFKYFFDNQVNDRKSRVFELLCTENEDEIYETIIEHRKEMADEFMVDRSS